MCCCSCLSNTVPCTVPSAEQVYLCWVVDDDLADILGHPPHQPLLCWHILQHPLAKPAVHIKQYTTHSRDRTQACICALKTAVVWICCVAKRGLPKIAEHSFKLRGLPCVEQGSHSCTHSHAPLTAHDAEHVLVQAVHSRALLSIGHLLPDVTGLPLNLVDLRMQRRQPQVFMCQ